MTRADLFRRLLDAHNDFIGSQVDAGRVPLSYILESLTTLWAAVTIVERQLRGLGLTEDALAAAKAKGRQIGDLVVKPPDVYH